MNVLHLCPLWYPIRRDAPGGIETLLAQLVDALREVGCDSTLLASGDSQAGAPVLAATPWGLHARMAAGQAGEYEHYQQRQLVLALEHADDFDVVHSHVGAAAYHLSAVPGLRDRVVHTTHWPVHADLEWFVGRQPDYWYSAVSEHQAAKLRAAGARRCPAIPNGVDVGRFTFRPAAGRGLLFIGRMEAAKGPDVAVRVARRLGRPLTLAGPIVEAEFFERCVAPGLGGGIRYVGVVDHRGKDALFGEAACALLPFQDEEPFGLVAVEAMACGTPVVALANGALPEIVEDGVTGWLGRDESDLPSLVEAAAGLDRAAVRARAAARFDIARAALGYRELYERMRAGAGARVGAT